MSDPRAGYFSWRTSVAKRDGFPDIDYPVELILRECWGEAYNLGRKHGVLETADLRSAADSYRDFTALLERWDQERMILLAAEANA
jgi:hypothetical protein